MLRRSGLLPRCIREKEAAEEAEKAKPAQAEGSQVSNGVCPYKMKVKKRGDQWWILGVDQMDPEGMGPYPSKEEAEYRH